jgi:hypothetical protein
MKLFWRDPSDPLPQEIDEGEDRTLGSLGLQDGFEVLIDEVGG